MSKTFKIKFQIRITRFRIQIQDKDSQKNPYVDILCEKSFKVLFKHTDTPEAVQGKVSYVQVKLKTFRGRYKI